jgi:hypothetical protein
MGKDHWIKQALVVLKPKMGGKKLWGALDAMVLGRAKGTICFALTSIMASIFLCGAKVFVSTVALRKS